MLRILATTIVVLAFSTPVFAIEPFPASFKTQEIATNGTILHARVGGSGPAVVLLHGFGDTGDMWAPLARILVQHHTVIVPDLRGMGLSSHPDDGYTKVAQARDLAGILDKLHVTDVELVTHDIGNMVGYAFAAQYGARVSKWVVMDHQTKTAKSFSLPDTGLAEVTFVPRSAHAPEARSTPPPSPTSSSWSTRRHTCSSPDPTSSRPSRARTSSSRNSVAR